MTTKAIDKGSCSDKTLRGASILGKLLGLAVPVGGVGVDIVVDAITQRTRDRRVARLERLLQHLGQRIGAREEATRVEPVDLLDEIIAQAVTDEDCEKVRYYVGLIDYVVAARPHPYEVRLLANALKQMTHHDIDSFLFFRKNNRLPPDLPEDLEDCFWNRIEPLGIFKGGGVKDSNNITKLGQRFFRVCIPPDQRPL